MTKQRTIILVTCFLGVFMLVALAGVVYLIDQGTDAALVAVVSTPLGGALGALSALLASTRTGDPAPVNVVNTPTDPVPVQDADAVPAARREAP